MTPEQQSAIKKRIARIQERVKIYEELYEGKEMSLAYHGGFTLGYWKGKLSALEDILDMIEDG